MGMSHLNVEIKARCANPECIRTCLRASHAEFRGVDAQVDTYFQVPRGRLKLREGNIENNLIYYERGNEVGPKDSHVSLLPISPDSPLKNMLVQALGVLVVVEKRREIYFVENVKFHIDEVRNLGSFVEIEAIDATGALGRETLLAQCQACLRLFMLQPEDLVAVSYSDLLLAQHQRLA
jgi:predicted adenylyl cyclase CyaB